MHFIVVQRLYEWHEARKRLIRFALQMHISFRSSHLPFQSLDSNLCHGLGSTATSGREAARQWQGQRYKPNGCANGDCARKGTRAEATATLLESPPPTIDRHRL